MGNHLPPKICPICKAETIENWESACSECWKKLEEHDKCPKCKGTGKTSEMVHGNIYPVLVQCGECAGSGFIGDWRSTVRIFNHAREFCRRAGFDPLISMPF